MAITDSLENAFTSINDYFNTTVKAVVDLKMGSPVCFYFQGNQKLTYPGVVIHQYTIGGDDEASRQKYNQFEVHIQVNKNEDFKALRIADAIENVTGFKANNVLMIKQIPLKDWASKKTNADKYGCIDLKLQPGPGFVWRDDTDKDIRHYVLDLEAYYK